MTKSKTAQHEKKDFVYSNKTQTSIFFEQASDINPYVSQSNFLHGYNIFELMQKRSFMEVILLLFKSELPTNKQTKLLERLFIGLMNLGPRHPAVKAAMVAGVSKTNVEHLLPIGLTTLGGEMNGAKEVQKSMLFIQENITNTPEEVTQKLLAQLTSPQKEGEFHLCPGFGNHYGTIDEFSINLLQEITTGFDIENELPIIFWANKFSNNLISHQMGWLKTGIAAAVFCELGIPARESIGLFQLICAPGIFAHGVEQTHKPITAIPMLDDEQHKYIAQK